MTAGPLAIREDDLSVAQPQALLRLHLSDMHAHSPPRHVFALDLSGLRSPDVTVWSAWSDDELVGLGALKALDGEVGEVKSMRTAHATCGEASARPCSSTSSARPAPVG